MDLSEGFDTLNHNLLIAKLKAYGLDLNAVLLIKNYLTNRYQRCKIGDSFSEWERIIVGVLSLDPYFLTSSQIIFSIY